MVIQDNRLLIYYIGGDFHAVDVEFFRSSFAKIG
jgi:hypothetical protein